MNTQHDDPLRRHLAGLADPAPPARLFDRIDHSRLQRRRRRQLLRGAAVALLLLAALLPFRSLLTTVPVADAPLAASARHLLVDPAPDPDVALRRIDRQLQAAYDRGADADTLHVLWLARERAAVHTRLTETVDDSVISL